MHDRIRLLLAAAAVITTTACTAPPEGPPSVVLRLQARDFGQPMGHHAPMLAIGRTAREVVALPRLSRIARLQGALFDEDVARIDLDVARVPAGATIELDVQALSLAALIDRDARAALALGGRFVRLEQGWQLAASPGGRARLTIERAAVRDAVPEEQDNRQVVARLQARHPVPALLTSRQFQVPRRASIEISYGILGAADTSSPPVRMSATLQCGDDTHPLLRTTIAPGRDAPGWRSHRTELLRTDASCSIELAQSDQLGNPSAFVVWGAPQITTPTDDPDLRIVLISLDTLRADHVSGYGYPRPTTPEIDRRLIRRGVRFADAMTTISSTGVAHLSLFTGLHPRDQRTPGRLRPSDATATLAERLQEAGFTTAAFTEDGLIAGPFGFWFGFDSFREYPVVSDARGTNVFDDAIAFVRANRRERFFLFLHTYKVHDPWVFGDATRDRFRDGADWADGTLDARIPKKRRSLVDDYDRTIVEADALVAKFLDELDRLDLDENTLIVLLSDHGEAFGEHGVAGHGEGFHQEQLHIPLVFRGPGIGAGLVRRSPVSITDVASTILALSGRRGATLGSGRSLAELVRVGTEPGAEPLAEQPLFFTWLHTDADGARLGPVKLVSEGDACTAYDLGNDPLEGRPVIVPCEQAPLARRIADYRAAANARHGGEARQAAEPVSIPSDTEESLRALGYVQ